MSNIYLDRLDRYVEQQLIPEYTRVNAAAAIPPTSTPTTRSER
jgi:hypothetical protein